MKVLVTGFTPFDGESVNPSWEAVKALPDEIGGIEICKLEIPTVYGESGDIVLDWVRKEKPLAVVLIGQAGGRKSITPERVAINVDDARIPDNAGNQPVDQVIVEGAREAYFSTLPIREIIEAVNAAGVPADISNTAGTFVCNHVMYRLLHEASRMSKPFLTGFVHVPYAAEQVVGNEEKLGKDVPYLAMQDIEKGLLKTIEAVVRRLK